MLPQIGHLSTSGGQKGEPGFQEVSSGRDGGVKYRTAEFKLKKTTPLTSPHITAFKKRPLRILLNLPPDPSTSGEVVNYIWFVSEKSKALLSDPFLARFAFEKPSEINKITTLTCLFEDGLCWVGVLRWFRYSGFGIPLVPDAG